MPKKPEPPSPLRLVPSPHNAMLPPNWRWERARLLRSQRRDLRREDSWVGLADRFQRALSKATGLAAQEKLMYQFGGLCQAWDWYEGSSRMRWSVEAYLCSGMTPGQVARQVGVKPETVGFYAKMFFDVVGKTKHPDYMVNVVFGRSLDDGVFERDYDLLWKLVGLLWGPQAVAWLTCGRRADSLNGHRIFADLIGRKTVIGAMTIPVAYNQEVLFTSYNKLVEIDRKKEDPDDTRRRLGEGFQWMLVNIGFTAGRPERDPVDAQQRLDYDTSSVEPRAVEQFHIALGREPTPERRKLLTATAFPEPPGKEPAR